MEWLKKQDVASWVLKGFFVFALLFPAFYSPHTDVYQSAYYEGFSWAYLFLVIYMGLKLWQNWGKQRKISLICGLYLGILGLYNLISIYFNYRYLHWYWEQINNTVAFLLFLVLLLCEIKLEEEGQDLIRFLIHCIVLSNIGSLVYYVLGYTNLIICNNQFIFYAIPDSFYEARHYWIYSHKSEYALMLVLFVALFVAYREKFKNLVTFGLSLLVLLACLYLTHSWIGVAGVLLIFVGSILDKIDWKDFHLKIGYIVGIGAFCIMGCVVGYYALAERDFMSLGGRTRIWPTALEIIKKHPEGWGMRFGESAIEVAEGWYVNNAHNLFLNAILRFSVPVGICFTLLFLGIAIYSLAKSRSFLAAGMWIAVLILLNMDYALMSLQMALLFLIVYLVCFGKRKERDVG